MLTSVPYFYWFIEFSKKRVEVFWSVRVDVFSMKSAYWWGKGERMCGAMT